MAEEIQETPQETQARERAYSRKRLARKRVFKARGRTNRDKKHVSEILSDCEKYSVNNTTMEEGYVADKIVYLQELEADRNSNPQVPEDKRNKYADAIVALQETLTEIEATHE